MSAPDVGIRAFGAYVPRMRLDRAEVAAAHAWVNPGLRSLARGERSICGWDEDAVTMAVEAARGCLGGSDRPRIGRVYFGSTTAPYADRLNVGVVAGALGLDERISAFDLGGSLRAGTSALLTTTCCALRLTAGPPPRPRNRSSSSVTPPPRCSSDEARAWRGWSAAVR
jgi:hydroxymethylglutaryl-CoA synthase